MRDRIGTSTHHKPRVKSRPAVKRECNIAVQQDEKFCSACGSRWDANDDTFECPWKKLKG